MAKSWRDFARPSSHDDRDVKDDSPPIVAIVPNVTAPPSRIVEGLGLLRAVAVPLSCDPERWADIRDDAESLVAGGWVDFATELGWSDFDLFGVVGHPEDDPREQGLAAWLQGRRLRALSDDFAVVVSEEGGRFYFNPRHSWPPETRLLWDVARQGAA